MNLSMGLLWILIMVIGLMAVISLYIGKVLLERIKSRYLNLRQEISVIEQQMELEHLSDLVRWTAGEGILDHKASQKMLKHILELKEEVRAQNSPV